MPAWIAAPRARDTLIVPPISVLKTLQMFHLRVGRGHVCVPLREFVAPVRGLWAGGGHGAGTGRARGEVSILPVFYAEVWRQLNVNLLPVLSEILAHFC
jgi:hypothetical protein